MRLCNILQLCLLVGLSACGGLPPSGEQAVDIPFALKAGNTAVDCRHDIAGLGSGRVAARLRDARLYVSDLRLIDAEGHEVPVRLAGNDWQYAGVALVDLEDGTGGCKGGTGGSNDHVLGSVPKGHYVGLSFVVGVPVSGRDDAGKEVRLNHSSTETSPAPLDLAAMGWAWQAGRKFIKIEVDPAGGIALPAAAHAQTWFVHLGSTDCKGNPADGESVSCANANRIPIRLERFDLQSQQVVVDLVKLFEGSDLNRDQGGAVGCMSGVDDPECPAIFTQLGLNLTASAPAAHDAGQPNGRMPPVFRVEAKP